MIALTRDEALATLEEGQRALEALFAKLSDEQMTRPGTIGGAWSAKDLLGHIAFWEELAIEAIEDWRAGRRPAVEQIFDGGGEGTDAANARDQARSAEQPLGAVRARAAAAHAAIGRAIAAMPDAEWRAPAFYQPPHQATLGELLGSVLGAPGRPFQHASAHLPDLTTYVDSPACQ